MTENNLSREKLLMFAENSFKQKDYAKSYGYCTELMKGKSPSIVVYMQCISSLELRRSSKDFVDPQINDTLLLTVALDNFYDKSYKKNKKIKKYIRDIIFCLLLSNIESVQNHYGFKRKKRSLKQDFANAHNTISNLRLFSSYDFSRFSIDLPEQLVDFVRECGEKLVAFVSNSIIIMEDPTNNWIFEDETNDLYERIILYQNSFEEEERIAQEAILKETVYKEENDLALKNSKVNKLVDEKPENEKSDDIKDKDILEQDDIETMVSDDIPKDIVKSKSDKIPVQKLSRGDDRPLSAMDIIIGVLVVLFVIALGSIALYLISPNLFESLFALITG